MATALTINVHEIAKHTLPAALEERLKGSPTAETTPDALADALAKHNEKAAKLRNAHLEAIKDRAARESQRALDAKARKLRLAAVRVEKAQTKLTASETKANAKKEQAEAERDARKQHREAMQAAVMAARREADKVREVQAERRREQEKVASTRHAKTIQSLVDKSHYQVKHAVAVAAAQKEKLQLDAVTSFEKLNEKLAGAALRRELEAAASSSTSSASATASPRSSSPDKGAPLHRVLNDDKVASLMKRKLFVASMDQAEARRAAHLKAVAGKASKDLARVASVVASVKTKEEGTDEQTASSKAAMYERLLKAEVARLTALKAKYLPPHPHTKLGDTVSVIVVKWEHKAPKLPPSALSLRLSVVSRTLMATAAARQAGAASRRAALAAARALKCARANERRAVALSRIGAAHAKTAAAANAKEARSAITLAMAEGARLATIAKGHRRVAAAEGKRAAAAAALATAGAANAKKGALAAEKRVAFVRGRARVGVPAVRAAASKSRRDALQAKLAARGGVFTARNEKAAATKAEKLAARVALARKSAKAPHPPKEKGAAEVAAEKAE